MVCDGVCVCVCVSVFVCMCVYELCNTLCSMLCAEWSYSLPLSSFNQPKARNLEFIHCIIFHFHVGSNFFYRGGHSIFWCGGLCTGLTVPSMGGPEGGPPAKNGDFRSIWGGRPPHAPPYLETLFGAFRKQLRHTKS